MKYKIGEKVKIREDLIVNKWYGRDAFASDMAEYKGKIAKIVRVNEINKCYDLDIDEGFYFWTDEMFEEVEIPKSELQNKIVELERTIKNNYDEIENLKQKLKNLKEPILDEVERKYLLGVIRPFKDKADFIKKGKYYNNNTWEYIQIYYYYKTCDYAISFPDFKKGTMYKGMQVNRKYTLKELGLDE